jgi:hypothetical protein
MFDEPSHRALPQQSLLTAEGAVDTSFRSGRAGGQGEERGAILQGRLDFGSPRRRAATTPRVLGQADGWQLPAL